jgi:hypothetical protein
LNYGVFLFLNMNLGIGMRLYEIMIKHKVIGKFDSTTDYEEYDIDDDDTSWHKTSDRKLVKHPVHIKKLEKMFSKTPYNFAIFVIDNKNLKTKFIGKDITHMRDSIAQYLEQDDVSMIYDNHDNCITLLVLENAAGEINHPMTPWIYAHKLWHFIDDWRSGNSTRHPDVMLARNLTISYEEKQFGLAYDLDYDKCNLIGTSASFKNKKVNSRSEATNELFCQYINTGGKVILNTAHSILSDSDATNLKNNTEHQLEKYFSNILESLVGKIMIVTA